MVAITDITGIGPVLAAACAKNGYGTVRKIATTSAGKLAAVPGISEVKARTVIEAAKLLLGTEVAAKDQPKAKKTNKGKKKSKKGKKQFSSIDLITLTSESSLKTPQRKSE